MNFCLRWQENPALFRHEKDKYLQRIQHLYGKVGLKNYLLCLDEQNGKCKVCKRKMLLVADHKPGTMHFRGLLCFWCNSILGHVERFPWVLDNFKTYLN